MKKASILVLFAFIVSACQKWPSDLKLPSILSDNMLLQQKTDANIWGKANPGQKISITPSWGSEKKVKTGKDGRWLVKISTPEAGGIYTIVISTTVTTITIGNILIGEVKVSSTKVLAPAYIRYCWRNGAIGTLFNSNGLPASEFTAGK